jgi:hypothetical protein
VKREEREGDKGKDYIPSGRCLLGRPEAVKETTAKLTRQDIGRIRDVAEGGRNRRCQKRQE